MSLNDAEQLKFRLFAEGLTVSSDAQQALQRIVGDNPLSSNDFASTSGLILQLAGNVWVNAPISQYNPNFVSASSIVLEHSSDGFIVRGTRLEAHAKFWLQPKYHSTASPVGSRGSSYVVTHGDRARLSPLSGCAIACKFCDVPYGEKYGKRQIQPMLDALATALSDPVQPARHVLISGGTPRPSDFDWLRSVYRSVLAGFPGTDVDIMMVPAPGLLELNELAQLGVKQLSINLELFSDDVARTLMPHKHRQGRSSYLEFIERAVNVLGKGQVRSMLMVGLEPPEDTLRGVQAIVDHGGVPVLSPFRPDPSTPLRNTAPATAALLETVFLRATEIALKNGSRLGPECAPCTHNTLTLVDDERAKIAHSHPQPQFA